HAQLAEFFLQADGGAEHAAVDAHVLAQHHDRVVVLHFISERLGDGFDKRDGGHVNALLSFRRKAQDRAVSPKPQVLPRTCIRTSRSPVASCFPDTHSLRCPSSRCTLPATPFPSARPRPFVLRDKCAGACPGLSSTRPRLLPCRDSGA